MIERLNALDIPETKHKINELVDAVNDLEVTVYGGDDDCDDICPDCWAETEPFIASLPDLSDEQLMELHDRVADLLDERLEDDDLIEEVVDDVRSKSQPREIDTTDGLFSDFTAYVAAHPELRFYQALTNWSGYKKILGEDEGEDRYDLFYETTKGPKT